MLFWIILVLCSPLAIRLIIELIRICKRRPFIWLNTGEQWAVVTGSTDGIGYEFARQLALKGYHLMLISRNADKLEATKRKILDELRSSSAATENRTVQIRTHSADFTRLDIYEAIGHFLDPSKHDIFILVNNVGTVCDLPNYFLGGENFSQRNEQLINVNLVSMTKLCELVLPAMERRRRGLVINISSSSTLIPSPTMSVYAATKAFVNKLNDCLAEEFRSVGVTFCLLPIWLVSTNMTQHIDDDRWVPSPKRYVRSALATIRYQESFQSAGYWPHSLLGLAMATLQLVLSPRLQSYGIVWFFAKLRKYFTLKEQSSGEKGTPPVRLNMMKVIKLQ